MDSIINVAQAAYARGRACARRATTLLSTRWRILLVAAVTCTAAPLAVALAAAADSAPSRGERPTADRIAPEVSRSHAPAASWLRIPFARGAIVDLVQWGPAAQGQIAAEIAGLGASWDRIDVQWSAIEPRPGVYRWAHIDAEVAVAKRYGIHLLPVVSYAPSWTYPENARGYARFVAAAVRRYGPGTRANITWWELWNEPNYTYRWSNKVFEPKAYARDVRAAAKAAKAVKPAVKVLMFADYEDAPQQGGSSPWQTTMIDDYFSAVPDLAKWIDGISVLPYSDDPSLPVVGRNGWKDRTGGWAFGRVDQIRKKFLSHGANLPMWITEVGWSTYTYSDAAQAKHYRDLIAAVRRRPWIRALFAFCLREWQAHPSNDQSGYGLLTFGNWTPKPAYRQLQLSFDTLT